MKPIYASLAFLNAAVVILALAHFNQGRRIKALEAAVAGNPQVVSRVGNCNEFHLVFTNFNSAIGAAVAQGIIRERK